MDMAEQGDIEHTLVMSDTSGTETGSKSGSLRSDIVIEGSHKTIETVDLNADSSLDFRRTLEKSGKRYQIRKMIAEGGFGRIFLAKDLVLGRDVIIKSLKEEHLARAGSIEKFISEAKLNAQLDHPAIVPIFSLDTDSQDGLHLAMQLINGITLKEYLRQCREKNARSKISSRRFERALQTRLEGFLKVCDAIEYCHRRGIVHCDLKPENIMLGQNGVVYVMDWGIACPVGTQRTGHVDGTPAYMAPELFQEGVTNPLSDIFALGMILNEIVTLRKHVSGANSQEIIAKIRTGQYEPSTPENPRIRISSALSAIIEKARAPRPDQRYQSAKALASDIRHWLFQEEVSALPDSPLQKLMRFLFRHRYATLLILAAVFCASAAMALYGMQRQKCVATQVTLEMMRRLKVQLTTEDLATEIDNKLLRIREQLRGFATAQLIEQNAPEKGTDQGKFYLVEDFAPGSPNRPPELVKAPFYKNDISLMNAVYFKPASMPAEELEPVVKNLRTSRRQGLVLICDGMEDAEDIKDYTPDAVFDRFCRNGSLLRRITYVLDNGIAMRYPGMYEEISGTEDFQCNWIKSRLKDGIKTTIWSPPYLDTSDHAVVACWTPLLSIHGEKTGMVGFELCYHKLIQSVIQQAEEEGFQTTYYLLDSEDNLIFSSDAPEFRDNVEHVCESMIPLKQTFRYPDWIARFRSGNFPQFIARLDDGRLVRVSLALIPQAGWTLIRVVPPGTVDQIDMELDQRNRQDIEQDIFMERELFTW